MHYNQIHSWEVKQEEARHIQEELSKRIELNNCFDQIKTVAGCDVAYSSSSDTAFAALCIFSYPEIHKLSEIAIITPVAFPYISGLLTFREGPVLLKAFEKLNDKPDIVIFNGQGIAHPRKMGLASHLGLLLDVASIGCAQRSLFGKYNFPDKKKGAYTKIYNKENEVIGACLRTKDNINPVFVSQGHKIDLKTSIDIILKCTLKYKLPGPIRGAHILATSMKKQSEIQ